MKKHLLPALILSAASLAAHAAAGDSRIRTIPYQPNEVVRIYTAIGHPTLIQFEEDETVEDAPTNKSMIGLGDAKAWKVGPKGSNVMLKPAARKPDTTMVIVTNKRSYAFDIVTVQEKSAHVPTTILRFDYPDSRAKAAQAASQKRSALNERMDQIADRGPVVTRHNVNYMMQGDTVIAPTSVSDDGRFTFMVFDSTRELPVVYKVLPDGAEALTNYHMENDTGTMVIHETAGKFMLRYGSAVLALRNDGFNPDGKLNVSGTTVPNAVRLPRGEK